MSAQGNQPDSYRTKGAGRASAPQMPPQQETGGFPQQAGRPRAQGRRHMGVASSNPEYMTYTGARPDPDEPDRSRAQRRLERSQGRGPFHGPAKTGETVGVGNYLSTPTRRSRSIFTSRQERRRRSAMRLLIVLIILAAALAAAWFFFLR